MTQPPSTPSYQMPPRPQGGSGLAVASLVLGIIAVFTVCVWFVSIPLAVIAIVLGLVAVGKIAQGQASGGGLAKAGMILGIVACVLAIIVYYFLRRGGAYLQKKAQEIQKQAEDANKKANEQLQRQQQNPLTQPSGSAITPMQWRAPSQLPGFADQTLFLVLPNCA